VKKRLPKSLRKFIRSQKALIRSRVLDFKKQEELITELYKKLLKPIVEPNQDQEAKNREDKKEMKVKEIKEIKVKTKNLKVGAKGK